MWGNRHLVATGLAWALCAVSGVLVFADLALGLQTVGRAVPALFEFRWFEALFPLTALGFSLVGAFWFLYILGYNLSPAVWVGLIALAGLDAETGELKWDELVRAITSKTRLVAIGAASNALAR